MNPTPEPFSVPSAVDARHSNPGTCRRAGTLGSLELADRPRGWRATERISNRSGRAGEIPPGAAAGVAVPAHTLNRAFWHPPDAPRTASAPALRHGIDLVALTSVHATIAACRARRPRAAPGTARGADLRWLERMRCVGRPVVSRSARTTKTVPSVGGPRRSDDGHDEPAGPAAAAARRRHTLPCTRREAPDGSIPHCCTQPSLEHLGLRMLCRSFADRVRVLERTHAPLHRVAWPAVCRPVRR